MEYFKGKLRHLLISSNVWLSLPRHEGRREKIKKQADSVARPAGRSKAVIVQRVERIIVSDPGKSFAFCFSACQIQTVSAQLLWNCGVKSDIFIITIFALFFFCPCLGRVSKVKPPEPSAPEQLFCPLPNLVCSGFCPLQGGGSRSAAPLPLSHTQIKFPRPDSLLCAFEVNVSGEGRTRGLRRSWLLAPRTLRCVCFLLCRLVAFICRFALGGHGITRSPHRI